MKRTTVKQLSLALAMIGGCAAIAYGIGRSMREQPADAATRWQQEGSAGQRAAASAPPSSAHANLSPDERAKKVAAIQRRLSALWECAPFVVADWEAERETQALLKQLQADELISFLRETKASANLLTNYHIRRCVAEALIARGQAPAALEQSMTFLADSSNPIRTFEAWAKRDAEKAFEWLRNAELSPELEEKRSAMQINALHDFAKKDFARAAAELPYVEQEDKRWFLNSLAGVAQDDDSMALLKELIATHDPDATMEIERSRVNNLANEDPVAALEHIAGLDLPAEQKADLEVAQISGASNKSVPDAYNAWISRREDTDPIPDRMWQQLERNFVFQNEDTLKWLDSMPAGATRDAFYRRGVRLLAARHDFEKAVAYAATIESPEDRQLTLLTLSTMWSEANPDAAKTWREGLPQRDRQQFE